MRRRAFVHGVGAGSVAGFTGLAGCLTRQNEDEEPVESEADDALRIATYSSMVTGETPAGTWLSETFAEDREDVTPDDLEWRVPEAGVEHFVRRGQLEAEIGADVYLGLTAGDLARVDAALGEGALFAPLERDRLDHDDRIRDELTFDDPADRVLPFGTGYLALVYDERELEYDPPTGFEELSEYADALLAQDPRTSAPGLAFLLWTIDEYGDDYLEYWRDLRANGLEVREGWTEAYREAYLEEQRPMVVSYSTDRVAASAAGWDLRRHQTTALEGQGFRTTEGVAVFADSPRTDLAFEFVDFVLSNEAQAEIARRNAQFPAVEERYVDLSESFATYADRPMNAVTTSYDDLRGDLERWLAAWDDEFGDEWPVEPTPVPDEDDAAEEGDAEAEGDDEPTDDGAANETGDADAGDENASPNATETEETTDYVA